MARLSKTGGKKSKAKARKASPAKGRKATKTKRRVAPAGSRRKRLSVADLQEHPDRYVNELKEAREQQAATAEILKVINASLGDLTPIFDIILEKAHGLCDVTTGSLELYEGDRAHSVAVRGVNSRWEQYLRLGYKIDARNRERMETVHPNQIVDVCEVLKRLPDNPVLRAFVEIGDLRTFLALPLIKDGRVFGRIIAARDEVRPFTDQQIALLQSFADQAVIAIENARLLTEQREALEQQTATAEVLQVINSSQGNLASVFDAILGKAMRLCDAGFGGLLIPDGEFARYVAMRCPAQYTELLTREPPRLSDLLGRSFVNRPFLHVIDVSAEPPYLSRDPIAVAAVEIGGIRTIVSVPLRKDGGIVGVFTVYRQEVRPFTAKQIALVQSFAVQAVTAIENARLFDEVQARTKELAQSLDDLRTVQDRLVQTEKLASLGQLTAGIAHEIKNPLNFVNNFSALSAELVDELNDVLKPAPLNPKMREDVDELTQMLKGNLEKVVQHGKRADSIVKNMLLHSREGTGEHRSADINALVEESLNLAYHGARAEKAGFNITLRRDLDPDAGAVELYPQEITRALLNLISNGFYAATKRKSEARDEIFEPVLSAATKNLGNRVEIRIRDNGSGIPREVKEKMFNPFFTTKPPGEGTGLGLSMSHDIIIKQHGGSIDIDSVPDQFTEIIVTLPRGKT